MESPTESGGNGQRGKERSPVLVVVLSLITFGLYGLYWIASVCREMDRFDPHRDSPWDVVKWALGLFVAGVAGFVAGWGSVFAGAASGSEAGLGAGMLLFGLGALLMVVGGLAMLFAQWRLWKAIEAHERSIGAPTTLSPGMMVVLVLVPVVNLIGSIYIPYRTQEGLNRIWAAADEGYEASPPQPAGGSSQPSTGRPEEVGSMESSEARAGGPGEGG